MKLKFNSLVIMIRIIIKKLFKDTTLEDLEIETNTKINFKNVVFEPYLLSCEQLKVCIREGKKDRSIFVALALFSFHII